IGRLLPGYPFHYMLVPVMIAAAVRFGPRGTTAVTAIASAVAIASTLAGIGPFAVGDVGHGLGLLQLFLATVAGGGLVLAAAIHERAAETRRREAGYAGTRALAETRSPAAAGP